jgi:hypothetical protein
MYKKMAASASILTSEERFCKMVLFLPTIEKTLKLLRVLFVLGPMERFTSVLPDYVRNERKSGKLFVAILDCYQLVLELNLAFRLLSPFKEQGLCYLIQEYENHVARILSEQLEAANLTPASFVDIVCSRHNYFQQLSSEVFENSQDLNDGYRRVTVYRQFQITFCLGRRIRDQQYQKAGAVLRRQNDCPSHGFAAEALVAKQKQ